jgi:citrate lyase subunit beta / citryl-CoA lyase
VKPESISDHGVALLLETTRRGQAEAEAVTAGLRAQLPLRFLRQQAHLTAPASDPRLAEKALSGAHLVARRLLERYAIDAAAVAKKLEVKTTVVEALLDRGRAPVVVLDLEDGVAPNMVDEARANAISLAREVDRGHTLLFVRPAGVADPRCSDDLVTLLVEAGRGLAPERYPIDALIFPKVRHVHEIRWLYSTLAEIETSLGLESGQIKVCYQIETGWGVANLPELAAAGMDRLCGMVLGTVDLSADLQLPEVHYRHPISEWARMMIITVAGACGVPALDGMTLDFPVGRPELSPEDNRALVLERMALNLADARHSFGLGMAGRWTGHPLQLLATLVAFHKLFDESAVAAQEERLGEFVRALSADQGAVASTTGELLDVGTDRHVRQMLRRFAAWGLLPADRARDLGLVSDAEFAEMSP